MFLYCSRCIKALVIKKQIKIPDWAKIDWDLIQRKRFMNWDAEVAPKDKFTKKLKKRK